MTPLNQQVLKKIVSRLKDDEGVRLKSTLYKYLPKLKIFFSNDDLVNKVVDGIQRQNLDVVASMFELREEFSDKDMSDEGDADENFFYMA